MEDNETRIPAGTTPGQDPAQTPAMALGEEISKAAEAHPAVSAAPMDLRPSRRVAVTAAARAMAAAERGGGPSVEAAPSVAAQLVDEAVASLRLDPDRKAAIALDSPVETRHHVLAMKLKSVPKAVRSGYDEATAIAKSEEAIARVVRMRLAGSGEMDVEALASAMTVAMVGVMMRVCADRDTPVGTLSDGELVHLAEDAYDAALPGVEGAP
jgi:hypothetical protein